MNIAFWLHRAATRFGDRTALMDGAESAGDYREFAQRAASFSAWLGKQDIEPGDRIAIFAINSLDYLIALLGIWWAGAAAVPINGKLHPQEANWIIKDSGASIVLVSGGMDHEIDHERIFDVSKIDKNAPIILTPVSREQQDLAWLFYTSGTTGRPKGVRITHGMLAAMSLGYPVDVDEVKATDIACYAAPMSHGAGLYIPVHVLFGAAHMVPKSGGFDATEILSLAAQAKAQNRDLHMFMAPTMVQRFTNAAKQADDRAEGLRTIVYGGAPMYAADLEAALDWFGPVLVQIYGQGECPMAISSLSREEIADRNHPDWSRRIASAGQEQAAVEVRIGDAEGNPLPTGEIGEIMVLGSTVMPGYWNRDPLPDSWLWTGDRGELSADGYLTLKDRSKDVIITGGSNVYPREVEEALLTHPAVIEVSVVGKQSREWGEEVTAFVVASMDIDASALAAHCDACIAKFKRPKAFYFVGALPKNNYGKVMKGDLRERLKKMSDPQRD
ncbi:class I adenylate-forming enzyme family protein [Ahrensia sp. R2A130]|uniref:class I adenylate-forming enzyme family protein n=1 Tax=Ahrensia sp. R2A130 TaxID=744979 RepID=UPI0001E08C29|nr:AMP-binding protein [Ahrensia sp. R2A130]EFL89527.1 feruloyl-CoA synthetase [Ahrensia sp. R2A130]